jgi:hypothetical protein
MVDLSFDVIIDSICTKIGPNTNLVAADLLQDRYHDEDYQTVNLLGIGQYRVPVALIATAVLLIVSPYLLPVSMQAIKGLHGLTC